MQETVKLPISKWSRVRFYDCHQANIDRDYSGENPKHYPIGLVVDVYWYNQAKYSTLVCDIQIADRISRGHFVSAVEALNQK
jgi:hypothetical protein